MNKKVHPSVRWGILSTARINRSLIPPLHQSKHSELTAVASRSSSHASSYASEWGIPTAYGSYEALLSDPRIDVIYNPLPNAMHTEWSIKAMEAGKHVLCEKPLCMNIDELDALAAASSRTGKVVVEAFMYCHHPQTLKVMEIVASGVLGRLSLIKGSFSFKLSDPKNPRMDLGLGGGSIWDVGCYPISYARLVASREPEEVFGWQLSASTGIDLLFAGQIRFADHLFAQFDCSFDLPHRFSIEIIGSTGSLLIPNPYKPGKREKIILTRGDQSETIPIRGQELYIGEVIDMENVVLHAQPPRISLADSRGNVATITALLESARIGKPVILNKS